MLGTLTAKKLFLCYGFCPLPLSCHRPHWNESAPFPCYFFSRDPHLLSHLYPGLFWKIFVQSQSRQHLWIILTDTEKSSFSLVLKEAFANLCWTSPTSAQREKFPPCCRQKSRNYLILALVPKEMKTSLTLHVFLGVSLIFRCCLLLPWIFSSTMKISSLEHTSSSTTATF